MLFNSLRYVDSFFFLYPETPTGVRARYFVRGLYLQLPWSVYNHVYRPVAYNVSRTN